MPVYEFRAKSGAGVLEAGTREAASEAALVGELRGRGLFPLEVRPAAAAGVAGGLGAPSLAERLLPPRSLDVELSLRQIAFMLRSGLPLLGALRTCARQSERPSMGRVWGRVAERIQEGASFQEALSEHRCFPRLALTMVGVGEETGVLDEVLVRASVTLERRRELQASVLTALTYPSIVVVLAVGVVAYIMVSLIPKLRVFLSGFGRKLPPLTQLLVDISTAVHAHAIEGAIALAIGVGAVAAVHAWPPGRLVIDRALLRIPIVGRILRIAATASFARTLGTLLQSGVLLTESLRTAEPLHANRHVAGVVAQARERVLEGSPIAEPLAQGGAFLPLLSSMVAVGEASGTLDDVLLEVATFHEQRLEAVIRRLSVILEPIVIIVVGGIVGFVYMAFFMAIYAIAGGR